MARRIGFVVGLLLAALAGCGEPSGAPTAGGAHPDGLAGHWRFTDVMTSPELSIVTDIHLVLAADGTCRTWTRHEDGSGDPPTDGVWKLDGDHLFLSPPGGAAFQDAGRVTRSGDHLRIVLPNGTVQVFARQ